MKKLVLRGSYFLMPFLYRIILVDPGIYCIADLLTIRSEPFHIINKGFLFNLLAFSSLKIYPSHFASFV